MKNNLTFWDKYDNKSIFNKWFGNPYSPFKVYIRKHIKSMNFRSILDYGAGLCTEYYGFKNDNYDIEYVAVDVTKYFVEEGQKKGINITLFEPTRTHFCDNTFDCVICLDVINHQYDFKEIICELLRVTKNEVIITFHKRFSDKEDDEIVVKREDPYLIVNYFSKKKIEDFLKTLNIKYEFEPISFNDGNRTILYLKK